MKQTVKNSTNSKNDKPQFRTLCCVCGRERTPFGWEFVPKGNTKLFSHTYCPECFADAKKELEALRSSASRCLQMIVVLLCFISVHAFGQGGQLTAVSPNSALPGTSGLTVTFTLPNSTPPTPPAGILPDSVTIGSISGMSLTHSSLDTVTAVFDLPVDETEGAKNAVVTFTTPQGQISFMKVGGFTVGDASSANYTNGPASAGYNLFSPITSTNTYLMDNDGNIEKTWSSSYNPGQSVYLLNDGSLVRPANTGSATFDTGGAAGRIEQFDWSGNLIWAYDYDTASHRSHHDVEVLPDGNILMIAWELKTQAEAENAGRNPSLLTDGELWPDTIIEAAPTGSNGGTIVWEWHVWDHLVQDYSSSNVNYGAVADHPELIDLNYVMTGPNGGGADWNHCNSIDYNADLDQILISVHNFSEIWVIDHNTTTAEAASHNGGSGGMGGDLLYRWGNPATYDSGSATDQQLFVQHDAHWIGDGLPGAGNILIFNNGQGRRDGDYSSVDEIVPPVASDGSYTNGLPLAPVWTYTNSTPTNFYASHISGAQRLPNGNTLICEGTAGYAFEVTSGGGLVWDYPASGNLFRFERYTPDFAGFDNTELALPTVPYAVVDTAQATFYNNSGEISAPGTNDAFYGQDAGQAGHQPTYAISPDGLTVYDYNTRLTWTRSSDLNGDGTIDVNDKLTYADLAVYVASLNVENYAGHNDWRIPSIKELYSLIDFRGGDPSSFSGNDTSVLTPYLNTNYFTFAYGDTNAGERVIDAQYASSTFYVSTTMGGNKTLFGVNFADGRIKGYPQNDTGTGPTKTFYAICVRGNTSYGINRYSNNGDGTITDSATGLMWSQNDSRTGLDWTTALAYVGQLNAANYLGHSDWRLPNIKELQSILDYTRSPDTTGSAAIDPIFNATAITNEEGVQDWGWYWSGTTHADWSGNGSTADYMAFGRAMGYWNSAWEDVHGAGAQRSDPKSGSLTDYTYVPYGYYHSIAPQGDVIRLYNFVRVVRDGQLTVDTDGDGLSDSDEKGTYGTNPNDPDSDDDGMNDGAEIVAGTSPLSDTDYLFVGISQVISNTVSLYWPSVSGRTYCLEGTTHLSSGTWETNGVYSAVPPMNTVDFAVTNNPYFFRLRVEN